MTHPRSSGFSVVELLVALGLLSVLSAVAVPSFNVIRGSYERQTAEHQFALDLLRARAVASQYNARAIVQLAADGRSYTIGMDYSPYNVVPAADEVDFTRNITGGVSIGPIGALVFDARGYLVNDTGNMSSYTFHMSQYGSTYLAGTVFPLGVIEFD